MPASYCDLLFSSETGQTATDDGCVRDQLWEKPSGHGMVANKQHHHVDGGVWPPNTNQQPLQIASAVAQDATTHQQGGCVSSTNHGTR